MKKQLNLLKNERGLLTLDLVFALSLTLGGMIIVFALTLTFASIEVAQYVAFSTSRAYYAGHTTPEKQEQLANAKYLELTDKKSALRALLRPTWFDLKLLGIGDFTQEYQEAGAISGSYSPMSGAQVQIKAKLLAFNIPFFGRTSEGDGLQTKVDSYLGREPSASECKAMVEQRWKKIKGDAAGGFKITDTGYFVIMDDGC